MALIKCPECGRENVSDSAEMCPNCGYGIKEHFRKIERKKQYEESKRISEEKEQAELNKIKMPSKPSIGRNLLIFGIPFIPLMLLGLLVHFKIGFWFFLIFWLIIACSSYNDEVKGYKRAQQDFRKYQKEELDKKRRQEYERLKRLFPGLY